MRCLAASIKLSADFILVSVSKQGIPHILRTPSRMASAKQLAHVGQHEQCRSRVFLNSCLVCLLWTRCFYQSIHQLVGFYILEILDFIIPANNYFADHGNMKLAHGKNDVHCVLRRNE